MAAHDSESEINEAADLLPPASNERDDFCQEHLTEEQALYEDILAKSLRKVRLVIFVALLAPLMCTTRWYVMELYMPLLSETATTAFISNILFVGFFLGALESFCATWLGDKYGHDNSLLFVFLMNGIGVLLESVATHGQLWLFTVGYFFTGFAFIPITMAYIAFLLPHKHAISYMSLYFTLCSIVYLLGPLVASLIAQYTSYRNVFWFNTYIVAVCILVVLVFILRSQSKLQSLQVTLSQNFVQQQEEDDIFPVCNVQNNDDVDSSVSWSSFFRDIGRTELIVLSISMLSNCVCWTLEVIYLFHFAPFFMNRFQVSLVYSTSMFLVMVVCYGVATLSVPKIIEHVLPRHVYIVSVSAFIVIATQILVALTPSDSDFAHVFVWILLPIWGSAFGAMQISTEMCILEVQPKQHSGKVSGAKEALKIACRAVGIWLVGQFWTAPLYNSFCIVNGMCALIVFILSFLVWYFANRLE